MVQGSLRGKREEEGEEEKEGKKEVEEEAKNEEKEGKERISQGALICRIFTRFYTVVCRD